jgi:hypothetical protein
MSDDADPAEFVIQPASESDINRLMEIQFSAFQDDPYHNALYPGDQRSPVVFQSAGRRTIQDWRNNADQQTMMYVTVRTGEILGFASWNFFLCERPEKEWKKSLSVTWAEGREKERAESFLGATMAMRQKTCKGRPHGCEFCHSFSITTDTFV